MPFHINKDALYSINNRILIFALVVTLIPALVLGSVFYHHTRDVLLQNAEQELRGGINHTVRELELWFKDRSYDIRVFSNSFIVSESLERTLNLGEKQQTNRASMVRQITDYLTLVRNRFQDFHRLLVLDTSGKVVTESPQLDQGIALPPNWRAQLTNKKMILGEVSTDDNGTVPHLLIAVPVLSNKGATIGILAAEVSLEGIEKVLSTVQKKSSQASSTELFLLRKDGVKFLSTAGNSDSYEFQQVSHQTASKLFDAPETLSEHNNSKDETVVGILAPVSQLGWGVVMEKGHDEVFAEITKLRNLTVLLAIILLSVIGIISYLVSQSILTPLNKLSEAADEVAQGNLKVELPIKLRDEIGVVMSVFNNMVKQLSQSHEELETLSITDPLTGLANRKHVMEVLDLHFERYRRHNTPFSILMMDVDHFKQINDEYGHLAGDMVLKKIGEIFGDLLRTVDTVGRYGGEEFLIILDQTEDSEAVKSADRIRKEIEKSRFHYDNEDIAVTVSIGVSMVGEGKAMDSSLIHNADEALYEAKRNGRNRVILDRSDKSNVTRLPAKEKDSSG